MADRGCYICACERRETRSVSACVGAEGMLPRREGRSGRRPRARRWRETRAQEKQNEGAPTLVRSFSPAPAQVTENIHMLHPDGRAGQGVAAQAGGTAAEEATKGARRRDGGRASPPSLSLSLSPWQPRVRHDPVAHGQRETLSLHSMRVRCVCGGRLAPPPPFFLSLLPWATPPPSAPGGPAPRRRSAWSPAPAPPRPGRWPQAWPGRGRAGSGRPGTGSAGRTRWVGAFAGGQGRASERVGKAFIFAFFPAGARPLAHRPGARVRPHHHPHLVAMEAADDPLQFADLALDDDGGGGTGGVAAGALPDAPVFAAPPPPAPVAEDEPPPPYESVMAGSSTSVAGLAPVSVPEVRERERREAEKTNTQANTKKKSCIASQRPRPPLPHSRTHPTTRHDRPWPRRLPHHGLCR